MGYQIVFKYCEEVEKGEYNKEDLKTKTVKVGTAEEDIDLSVVAGKIMAQLARRNILVMDVEIYEFTKKKLSYKESSDGLVIKNKKFRFDDGAVITESEPVAEPSPPPVVANQATTPNPQMPSPPVVSPHMNLTAPIRHEIYDPEIPALAAEAKKRGYKFTVGKEYPIYKETTALMGLDYTTVDDSGVRRVLVDKYFVPITRPLMNGFETHKPQTGPKLSYSDSYIDDMPVLRR